MRLDKFLALHLEASRSEVTKLLKSGRITVNDQIVKQGSVPLLANAQVEFDNHLIASILDQKRYFLLHKPKNYVCSNEETLYPSVHRLIDEVRSDLLHSAGRLDADTTGLVLLTDDGQWSHRVTSPKAKCPKKYLVTVSELLTSATIVQFEQGLQLKGEKTLTKPAKLELLDPYHAYVTLSEGKYHQIKRMFAAIHNHVIALHRESIGSIILDVEEGRYRALTDQEIALF